MKFTIAIEPGTDRESANSRTFCLPLACGASGSSSSRGLRLFAWRDYIALTRILSPWACVAPLQIEAPNMNAPIGTVARANPKLKLEVASIALICFLAAADLVCNSRRSFLTASTASSYVRYLSRNAREPPATWKRSAVPSTPELTRPCHHDLRRPSIRSEEIGSIGSRATMFEL